jgi:hypothetical protein
MRRAIVLLLVLLAFAASNSTAAQGIEGVLVERYHSAPGATAGAPPLVTYRIYLDLAPGHALVSVFGERGRNLFFRTTTTFFNDTLHGAASGERVAEAGLRSYPAALDSWIAFGFASSAHKAVPLHLDPDGSVLAPSRRERKGPWYGTALHARDGLVRAERVPELLALYFTTSFLHELSGPLLETEIGAYGVRGSVKGATDENMVLIAQLTTDGELSYGINAAVMGPDGTITKHLAYPAMAADEVQLEALRSGNPF